jgi:uncharacterized protein YndB with AHSA1/START domain
MSKARTAPAKRVSAPKSLSTKATKSPNGPRSLSEPPGGISSAAVEKATGKPWSHWLQVLDKAGATEMPHRDIANLLYTRHKVPAWWAQMVTVGYEQARGLRVKHQTATGFSGNASRTIAASMHATFKAWTDDGVREKWLPDAPMTIRKATPGKSVRIAWTHPPAKKGAEPRNSTVEVNLWDKSKPGAPKTTVQVQENRLPALKDVKACKQFWSDALDRLQELLES